MPASSFTFEVVALDSAEAHQTVEDGFLTAVTMGPERIGTGNAEYFGQIFVANMETPNPIIIAQLAAGYFGAAAFISWTGRIRMEPTFAIYARIYSPSTHPVRCSFLTEGSP